MFLNQTESNPPFFKSDMFVNQRVSFKYFRFKNFASIDDVNSL